MKGYKVFNSDWTCRGFQYEVGKTYEMDEKPIICVQGFHFCKNLKDCFYYYPFREDTKIAEVEMLGDFDIDNYEHTSKVCTNKIKILREIHFENLITTTVPRTSTYTTNCYFRPDELEAFLKKYYSIIDVDILMKDSIKVISIVSDESMVDYSPDILAIMDPYCSYTYTIEYLTLIDVKEKK